MKKLIIALVFGMGLTGFAQESTTKPNKAHMEKMTPEQRQQKHLEKLTKELTLDTKQQDQIGKILAEKSAKMKELKMQMEAEKAAADTKMKAVLSADQYQKWTAMREENKKKMKHRRTESRE
jgi:protein CpxP